MAGAFACVGPVFLGLGQPLDRPIPSVHRGATSGQPHAGPPSRRPAHQRDNPAHLPVCGVYAGGAAASSPASMSWTARVRIPGPQPTEERAERWRECSHGRSPSSANSFLRRASETKNRAGYAGCPSTTMLRPARRQTVTSSTTTIPYRFHPSYKKTLQTFGMPTAHATVLVAIDHQVQA